MEVTGKIWKWSLAQISCGQWVEKQAQFSICFSLPFFPLLFCTYILKSCLLALIFKSNVDSGIWTHLTQKMVFTFYFQDLPVCKHLLLVIFCIWGLRNCINLTVCIPTSHPLYMWILCSSAVSFPLSHLSDLPLTTCWFKKVIWNNCSVAVKESANSSVSLRFPCKCY